jgi:polysaccharide deacetylase 2 family uncharacterized protein YibQ
MFTPLKYLTDYLFRTPSPPIPHSEATELVEAVNEAGEIIILEMPIKPSEKRLSSPLWLAPDLFEP